MIAGKTTALGAWLRGCPFLKTYLSLNAITTEEGSKEYSPVYNDLEVTQYIGGGSLREYTFEISIMQPWSSGFDTLNDAAQTAAERVIDWINSQMREGNMPDFGDSCTITDIKTLQNVPGVSAVFENMQLTKYSFQALIRYREVN